MERTFVWATKLAIPDLGCPHVSGVVEVIIMGVINFFDHELSSALRCPVCGDGVVYDGRNQEVNCVSIRCMARFPVINGIPCLINEGNSVFSLDDFVRERDLFFKLHESKVFKVLRKFVPNISANINAKKNYRLFAERVLLSETSPKVLVLGGSVLGDGIKELLAFSKIIVVESDVSFGPRTMLICDAHDMPFENESFDGVIIQAVLEHVVDPIRCVDEVSRILKPGGLVYAETPFIQQVHGRQFDFTRFTFLGHRRLFNKFDKIDNGAVGGPGMALAWSYRYFLLSFTKNRIARSLIKIFTSFTSFYLKYFDYYLIDKPGALDAASGFYFMGKKSGSVLSDKELIKLYQGAL